MFHCGYSNTVHAHTEMRLHGKAEKTALQSSNYNQLFINTINFISNKLVSYNYNIIATVAIAIATQ